MSALLAWQVTQFFLFTSCSWQCPAYALQYTCTLEGSFLLAILGPRFAAHQVLPICSLAEVSCLPLQARGSPAQVGNCSPALVQGNPVGCNQTFSSEMSSTVLGRACSYPHVCFFLRHLFQPHVICREYVFCLFLVCNHL